MNLFKTRKEEHSKKPVELYRIIEDCSLGPYLELFARERRTGWTQWGDELDSYLHTRPLVRGYNDHVHRRGGKGVAIDATVPITLE